MHKTCIINGSSDDLIEIGGSFHEEFSPRDVDEGVKLGFSDGTILSVKYEDDGCWRINRIHKGTAEYSKEEAGGPDGEEYSDVVTLKGKLEWCLCGSEMAKA